MSRRRSISTTISTDKRVNKLACRAGDFAALLYTWMIPHAEDSASMSGDPYELLITVVPGLQGVHDEDDVREALIAMDELGLIAWDGETVWFDSESYYRHQSYIPQVKRADNSEHFRESPKNAEEQRKTAKNSASLSPSPTPSPTRDKPSVESASDSTARKAIIDVDFGHWWEAFGKVGSRADARELYGWWREHGAERDELLTAAVAYGSHCRATDCKMQHGRTFLAKKPCRWREWADGEQHGSMDVAGSSRTTDVLTAIAQSAAESGGNNGHKSRYSHITGRPSGAAAVGTDARRRLPAGELEN